jgi:branched-chain amino acid transport system ATP-binding protein
MQSIIGLIPSQHGSVMFDGIDITKMPCHKIVHAGLTQVPEGRRIFQELTVYENLLMGGFSQKDQSALKQDIEKIYERFPRLAERKNQIAGTLSGGEQQRVAIARALINNPSVLFADEPSGNLDSRTKEELHNLFFTLRDKYGQTIIIVTHDPDLAKMCDRSLYMVDGQFVSQ